MPLEGRHAWLVVRIHNGSAKVVGVKIGNQLPVLCACTENLVLVVFERFIRATMLILGPVASVAVLYLKHDDAGC